MINKLKKKIFKALINLFLKFGHKYDPEYKTINNKQNFAENLCFFDLEKDLINNSLNFQENCLINVIDRPDNYLKKNKFIFECWAKNKNYTYTDNPYDLHNQKKKILKSFFLNSNRYHKQKIYLLPYYHNQAGHFISEILGSTLYFLEILKKRKLNEKLLIICPSEKWILFFKKFYKKNIVFFNQNFFLKKNIIFSNSKVLPKFNPYQNYLVSKHILYNKIENTKFKNKKIFLTSERPERIINIKELKSFLQSKGFQIVNPKKYNTLNLLKILNSAKILISECASIVHNVHISRNKPYYLLLPSDDNSNHKWHRLTKFYNNFHSCLYKPIYCKKIMKNNNKIPLQSTIVVDIKKLNFI